MSLDSFSKAWGSSQLFSYQPHLNLTLCKTKSIFALNYRSFVILPKLGLYPGQIGVISPISAITHSVRTEIASAHLHTLLYIHLCIYFEIFQEANICKLYVHKYIWYICPPHLTQHVSRDCVTAVWPAWQTWQLYSHLHFTGSHPSQAACLVTHTHKHHLHVAYRCCFLVFKLSLKPVCLNIFYLQKDDKLDWVRLNCDINALHDIDDWI